MRAALALLPSLALGILVAGCSPSSDTTPVCAFDDPPTLATSSWPKFRHDPQNTGNITGASLSLSPTPACVHVFPPDGMCPSGTTELSEVPKGAFGASPIFSDKDQFLYIGSSDHSLYALNPADLTQDTTRTFSSPAAIGSTAVAAIRFDPVAGAVKDAIYVGSNDGHLFALTDTAVAQPTFWPFVFTAPVVASPALIGDGTVYIPGTNGLFFGVCPNGIQRFGVSLTGSLTSTPAVGAGLGVLGTVYFGGDDRQLRAFQADGIFRWSFPTSAAIRTAPVVEVDNPEKPTVTLAIYVVDLAGRVFKVGPDRAPLFAIPSIGAVSFSSPALAGDHLYVGTDAGVLYAINKDSGMTDWSYATCDHPPCPTIRSSPAVATTDSQRIVVFGSDDGNLYYVEDLDMASGMVVKVPIGAPIASSPAIAADGTVYVGADDGRVYAFK